MKIIKKIKDWFNWEGDDLHYCYTTNKVVSTDEMKAKVLDANREEAADKLRYDMTTEDRLMKEVRDEVKRTREETQVGPGDIVRGVDLSNIGLIKLNNSVKGLSKFTKYDKEKLRYDLIPTEATKALAEVLTYGANKYSENNWKECDKPDRYIAALYRHLEAHRSGEEFDKESGMTHLKHALANIAFLVYFNEQ